MSSKQCSQCGTEFKPKRRSQTLCSVKCANESFKRPLDERFFSKVDFDDWNRDACWLWKGNQSVVNGQTGYGRFGVGPKGSQRQILAHRWSYEFFNGPVPSGKELHHNCENPLCVNPGHLEALTKSEHHRTKRFKAFGTFQSAKTHCAQGHPYSGDNLGLRPKHRGRFCRQCARDANRRYWQRKKASA